MAHNNSLEIQLEFSKYCKFQTNHLLAQTFSCALSIMGLRCTCLLKSLTSSNMAGRQEQSTLAYGSLPQTPLPSPLSSSNDDNLDSSMKALADLSKMSPNSPVPLQKFSGLSEFLNESFSQFQDLPFEIRSAIVS